MKTNLFTILLLLSFLLTCSDPNHEERINAIVEMGEVQVDLLPRIIVKSEVIASHPQIEPGIVLDFTKYTRNHPLPKQGLFSVTLVRQQPPNYYYNVISTMYD